MAAEISLQDDADNSALLSFCNGYLVSGVTLQGRTLYKDGNWNTLCLPFDVAHTGSPLEGAILMTLDVEGMYDDAGDLDDVNGTHQTGFDSATGTLSLYFKSASSIEAGKPYIIKWEKANDYEDDDAHNIVSPVFTNVTIKYTSSPVTVDDVVSFIGTYGKSTFDTEDKDILFLGGDNTLYYPEPKDDQNPTIGAQRAFFQLLLGGLPAGDPADPNTPVRAFNLNFGEEVNEVNEVKEVIASLEANDDSWFTLDGCRIANGQKPTAKGLYIHNGHKVVIK